MTPFQLLTGVKMRTKQDLEILKLLEEEIVETFTENREKFGRKPMKHSEDARRKTVEILIRNGKRHTNSPLVSMEIPLRTAYGQNGRCGMQPKPSSLRAQAHQSKSRTETEKGETLEKKLGHQGEKKERESYTRAFGDRPRNLEPWSSDEENTSAGTPPLVTTTPAGGRLSSRQIRTRDIPATSPLP
ncbi:hypothetical protein TNCV_3624752 [Trichonephila clavipes]|nr:hypothetical protein TNCV_3624752 [Trichonephila clavipes]